MLAAAQVVDAIAGRLGPVVLSGGRVYTSRLHPLTEAELPAWRVTADAEDVDVSMIDGTNVHTLLIECTGYVQATIDVDDAMHALAAQGLTAALANPPLYASQLQGIEREVTTEGEARLGVIRLRIATQFFVRPEAPETIVT
jgi:hypothetical protein